MHVLCHQCKWFDRLLVSARGTLNLLARMSSIGCSLPGPAQCTRCISHAVSLQLKRSSAYARTAVNGMLGAKT